MALLVHDAHWADPASLRFVDYLARRVSGLPVALVVAARSGESTGIEERLLGSAERRCQHAAASAG
jgi:predicted ATPase